MKPLTLIWAGGEHRFALPLGALRAVQDLCDAGPMLIYRSLQSADWRVDWPIHVVRHALIGGGMGEAEARKLVAGLSETVPLLDFVRPAILALAGALIGVPDDPVGEVGDEGKPPRETPASGGASPASTATARKPASRRGRSTE
jgi:Phage tail tube protein, GTA-gp10